MENSQQGQNQQLQVKVSDEVLKGVYANAMQVSHTKDEFVLDFMNIYPPAGTLNSRIIVSPAHFKQIVAALQDNLKKYEDGFKAIEVQNNPASPIQSSSTEKHIGFDTQKAD